MMHSKSFKIALTIATVVGIAFATPLPKDKIELNNEIIPSGAFVTKNGDSVSASWGGFQAAASLADDGSAGVSAGGNGLGASAGYGHGGAGADASVFGAGAVSETGSAGHQVKPAAGVYGNDGKPGSSYSHGAGAAAGVGNGAGFFDKIFAIPINVLQSVNTYLNQKQTQQGQFHGHHNVNGGAYASATAGSFTQGVPDKAPEAVVGADYGHGHGKNGNPMTVQTKTNYDEIFNIPITALRSVQNLLNG